MNGKITIDKILNAKTKYGDIFPNDPKQLPLIYKELCKQFHPDSCGDPRATDAFATLQIFYKEASAVVGTGVWEGGRYVEIKTTTGKTLQINYLYHAIFELGDCYVCNRNIIYIFDINTVLFLTQFNHNELCRFTNCFQFFHITVPPFD